jgi:hypothetical protein
MCFFVIPADSTDRRLHDVCKAVAAAIKGHTKKSLLEAVSQKMSPIVQIMPEELESLKSQVSNLRTILSQAVDALDGISQTMDSWH